MGDPWISTIFKRVLVLLIGIILSWCVALGAAYVAVELSRTILQQLGWELSVVQTSVVLIIPLSLFVGVIIGRWSKRASGPSRTGIT